MGSTLALPKNCVGSKKQFFKILLNKLGLSVKIHGFHYNRKKTRGVRSNEAPDECVVH